MKIVLMKSEKLENFVLPKNIYGNYWIFDYDNDNKKRNLVNIEGVDNKWVLKSNFEVKVYVNDTLLESVILDDYCFYKLKLGNETIILYTEPIIDNSFVKLKINKNPIYIGSNDNISYKLLKEKNLCLDYKDNYYVITDLKKTGLLYVNDIKVESSKLKYGDVIFICGLKIIVMKNYIYVNNLRNLVIYDNSFAKIEEVRTNLEIDNYDEDVNIKPIYSKDDYFYKSPRFKTISEKEKINIDAPPTKVQNREMPAIYSIGPMVTMSLTSVVFALSAINNMSKNGNLWTVIPSIVTAFAMITSCLLWPSLIKKYEKNQIIKNEKKRQQKYREYIDSKRSKINMLIKMQAQVLRDNYLSPKECSEIILNKKSTLWNREIKDDDFLSLRVGMGTRPLDVDINYREEDFMMEDDDLKTLAFELVNETRNLENVPISYSFKDKFISGIVGKEETNKDFLDMLILQLVTFYSYDEVKLVLLTNEKKSYKWDYLKDVPHIFSNDKQTRFFGTNTNSKKEISLYLERILKERESMDIYSKTDTPYKELKPYYVIISDDYDGIRSLEIVKDILSSKKNCGFSLIILDDKLSELPNECENFISVAQKTSGIFTSEVSSTTQQEFDADFIGDIDIDKCFYNLANIPVELANDESNLPKTISFLEMYNVGMVEQLNILNRYKNNDSVNNLAVPVGVDKLGELLYLDLHEKAHGPHGLIAGMTGSGKSEFIITYILSMAVNYSPNDVAFVLIDYKGGGLAGAFYNKETNLKLPHLAGTITNLDIADMNRSLVSIQSELRRRQAIFNEVRDKFLESTIDIYKYQTLFKEGKVSEPLPHLIIICDEFAELKANQPDFMDQLISTARIGRSLGVHLILATQKPSGVVNDQIWSNSKFRVCLKVQEKQDSIEMIKVPDAANIKDVGRFYLQVGYNELFILGQSAWAGAKYYPTEKLKKKIDTSINIIGDIGNIVKSIDKPRDVISSNGEEITNILKYIISSCNGVSAKKLWLDKISGIIYINDLVNKYNHIESPYNFNPIIGEYDDPSNQKQGLLSFNLSDLSSYIVYGIPGSGKELLLSTLIYSLITNHSPEEINMYIMDFGTESLKLYKDAPQVGDVISIWEDEKIDKLFQMFEKIIEERKKLFADYSGDYNGYVKNSSNKLPLILFILNNYDNFIETYENYFERLTSLVREGVKYGIVSFVTSTSPNNIRYRLKQNFKNEIVLELTNYEEYYNVFGRFDKIELSKNKGRGLIKLDEVYEFQTAYPCNEDNFGDMVRELCVSLNKKYFYKAPKIAVLPDFVGVDYIKNYIKDLSNVPVGVNKQTLDIETLNLINKGVSIITGQDINMLKPFVSGLRDTIKMISNTEVIVLDGEELLSNSYTSGYDELIDKMYSIFSKKDFTKNYVCILFGLDNIVSKLKKDTLDKFNSLLDIDNDLKNLSFIFVDAFGKLKKHEYEAWYKNNVNNNNGIWIGNGIVNQYTIMLNKITKEHRDDIPNGFGFVVRNGKTTLVKLVESGENYE